jgi:4-amino-4-deoxy-L-arabinose transferase-like glycosyltransferase
MVGITNPPLENTHWRQTTGLMVARNFLETDNNIFYPKVDDTRGETGIIGMEFPTLNYLFYCAAEVFGYQHWYGRIINLIISTLGILFFYKILKIFFKHKVALLSSIALLFSIWFSYSRKMMPDTYCISLMFIGLWFGIRYLQSSKIYSLLGYLFFTTIAVLSKIPAIIYLGIAMLLLFLSYERKTKIILLILTSIPCLAAFLWYFVWCPHLSECYGNWYNSGRPFFEGIKETFTHLPKVLNNFYFYAFYGFLFFTATLLGLFFAIKNRQKQLLIVVASAFALFVLYIFKSGYNFYKQDYYMIPFVPVMALLAGYGFSLLKPQLLMAVTLLACITESVNRQRLDFFIKDSEKYKLELPQIANQLTKSNDLIMFVNDKGDPQQLYLTHRKGWLASSEQVSDSVYMNNAKLKGCGYLFMDKQTPKMPISYKLLFENHNYFVYEIE